MPPRSSSGQADQPVISIIIVSWNVLALLEKCLASIGRYVDYPHQVIVVDNASTDGTVGALRQKWPNIEVVAQQKNLGFARANNAGRQRARGHYIAFLNPDTELVSEPWRLMIEYIQQHPKTGAIGPEILNPDHRHQQSVRNFPRWSDQVLTLLKLRHLLKNSRIMRRYLADPGAGRKKPMAVDQIMGAAMLFPKKILDHLGGFDEDYWIWFEEVDLCRRVHDAGYEVLYFPNSQIIHHGDKSFNQVLSIHKQVWFMRSLRRYARKHWSPAAAWSLWPLMVLSYLLTIIQMIFKPR